MSTNEDAQYLEAAIKLVVGTQFGSAGMLQRQLGVSQARAARLMQTLEEHGVVGPLDGPRARDVLITPDRIREAVASVLGQDPTPAEGST